MVGDIRKHLETAPFVPFAIHMADGRRYEVPAIDHVWLPPGGGRVLVSDDDGYTVLLPALLISGLTKSDPTPAPPEEQISGRP